MGWTEIEEMLEAESELDGDEQVTSTEPFPDWEVMDVEVDTMRHPLVARLLDRSVCLGNLHQGSNLWKVAEEKL